MDGPEGNIHGKQTSSRAARQASFPNRKMKPALKKSIALIALLAGLTWLLTNFPGPGSGSPAAVDLQSADGQDTSRARLPSIPRPEPAEPASNPVSDESRNIRKAPQEPETRDLSGPESGIASSEGDGAFSISGIAVDEAGYGVPGIEVTAFLKRRFEGNGDTKDKTLVRYALTGADGFYEFRGVGDGEYRISTPPDDYYEASQAVVRAGSDTADLVLRARQPELVVFGTIRSEGDPLENVQVSVVGQSDRSVNTDMDGFYELELKVSASKPAYSIRFVREGFREARSQLLAKEITGRRNIQVDTEMDPQQEQVEVSGTVLDMRGNPVAGQSVQLYSESARQRYSAKSDGNGDFWIEEVETSPDYMVSVRPKDDYRDFVLRDVDIGLAGADLEVILEPLERGSLTGQMLDPEGRPVPEFSLWLRNPDAVNQSDLLVTGDQQGFFEVTEVEEGRLIFETRSSPLYSISGITLSAREQKEIQLVLDQGNHQVMGLVVDETGRPVPATELFVTSLRHDNGLRTHAMRRAVTDASGYFIFNQVGQGYHTIRVEVPGYLTEVVDHVVGADEPEVVIRLERASLHGM
jgi:protocatechuate 3,4-dioxygenase beta subunit